MRIAYVSSWAGPELDEGASVRAHLAALAGAVPHAEPILLGPDPSALRERFAMSVAPDLSPYLLAPDRGGEPPNSKLMLRRFAVLVGAAEGRCLPPDAPDVGATIDLLGTAHALIDVAAASLANPQRGTLWSQAAAVCVAAARGARVLVSADRIGMKRDLDAVVLGRLLRSAALVTVRDGAGSAAYARRLGANEVVEGLDERSQLERGLRVPLAPVATGATQ
jgi:hypothetical protein